MLYRNYLADCLYTMAGGRVTRRYYDVVNIVNTPPETRTPEDVKRGVLKALGVD